MIKDALNEVLLALGYCLFIWTVAMIYSRMVFGEWFWQTWKRKKEREKEFEKWRIRENL